MAAGLTYALGNVAFGISCSQKGIYGVGFIGPASLLLANLYKFYGQAKIKRETGNWIDKENSNYWKRCAKAEIESNYANGHDDRYLAASEKVEKTTGQ